MDSSLRGNDTQALSQLFAVASVKPQREFLSIIFNIKHQNKKTKAACVLRKRLLF